MLLRRIQPTMVTTITEQAETYMEAQQSTWHRGKHYHTKTQTRHPRGVEYSCATSNTVTRLRYDRSRYHTVVLTGGFADWSARLPSTLLGGRGTGVVVGRRGSRYQTMLPVCPSVRLSDNPTPGYTIPLELNYHKSPCLLLRKEWTFHSEKKNFVGWYLDLNTWVSAEGCHAT